MRLFGGNDLLTHLKQERLGISPSNIAIVHYRTPLLNVSVEFSHGVKILHKRSYVILLILRDPSLLCSKIGDF